ncbi:MAG TPA: TonB-dependent receptor [Edaphobacter sp.]|nr:TonB-dependent receptor [Edaphobacter sp.]
MQLCNFAIQRLRSLLLLFVLFELFGLVMSWAQTATGTITGTVTDSGGRVVTDAQIVVQNRATHLAYKAQSQQDGAYVVPLLPVGSYEITITSPGFQTFRQTSATLDVAQRLRIDVALVVGAATQTVTVTSEEPPLQTEESSLGNVMGAHSIAELPLNGRQPFTLVLLIPGVQTTSPGSNGFADASNQAFSRLKINGGSTTGNQFLLDGAMDTLPTINEVSVIPMVDSIAEFRVMTNTLPAEFGQTSGGAVNLATKTGTNELHGSAYEFVRNDALNAVNRFAVVNSATGSAKPKLRYNQFGGTVGGPVWIPKIYNGHDRTFFFVGYEQWHQRSASIGYNTVPTPLQRSGDFSQTHTSTGALIPIYDPNTTAPNPVGNGFVRKQFSGNAIQSTRMDPLSLAVLKYIPLPNVTPQNAFTNANNFFFNAAGAIDQDVIVIRGDHRLSTRDSAFIRYASNLNVTHTPGSGLGISDPGSRNDTRKNYNLAIGETHTFSPTVLNEFRVSFVRQHLTYVAPSVGGDWPSKLGFPSIIPPTEFPSVMISGIISTGNTSAPSAGVRVGTVIQFANSLTGVTGKHALKFGFESHITRYNQQQQNYPSGQFVFSGAQTGNPQSSGGTGVGLADFLLGQVGSGQLTFNPGFSASSWSGGVYVQDDYKIKNNLTFNIGLRYDVFGPPTERHNKFSTFNPTLTNPETGMLGEMVYAGVTAPKTFVHYGYPYVAPRVGFAYSPGSRTVVRGGAAMIYNPVESADIHQFNNDAIGFSATNTFASSGPYDAFQFSAGPSSLIAPIGASGGPTAYRGQSVYFQDHDTSVPYQLQWNLTVQRELPGHWTASAGYVGSRGVRLLGGNYAYNQLDPAYWATYGSALQNQVRNPFYGQIATGPLSGPTISQSQALLPLPDYQSITTLARHGAGSIYHGLEATAEHRYPNGLTALVAYTKSKLIDDSSSSDSGESIDGAFRIGRYNPRLDRSLDSNDVSQNLAVSGVWELPFGQKSHGWHYLVIGGWQLNGLLAWQTGFPLTVTGSNNFTGTPYPNLAGNPTLPASKRSINQWFNTAAFAKPADYTLGNAPRTLPATRGPNYTNANASLTKNFRLWESSVLQFRTEAFNVFNHPQLGTPNTSFSPNSSGVNTNSLFGTINSALDPRSIQLGMHLRW